MDQVVLRGTLSVVLVLIIFSLTFDKTGEITPLKQLTVCRLTVDYDSLTITDVTESDAGVYTCIMNTTLDHDSASAELTVVGTCHFALAQIH